MAQPVTGAVRRLAAVLALVLLAAACGVRTQESAVRVDDTDLRGDALTTTTRPTGTVPRSFVEVYLLSRQGLVPVGRSAPAPVTPAGALAALESGPTRAESRAGLFTDVAADAISDVQVRGSTAIVHLAGGLFSGQGITAAAIGQIVFSATATGDAERVRFVVGGAPAEVPRGSGEPTAAPVTRADYEALLPGH